jgi:hypothetical protein
MSITKSKLNGLINYGVSQLGSGSVFTTGTVYYVSSTSGSNENIGTDPAFPKATVAGAQSAATASKGDIVVILPGHTETLTAALTLSKAGVGYVGLGYGSMRPTFTGNGAIDAISVTGANVMIANVRFPAPETDDQTADINVAASNCQIISTYHIGSQTAKNKTDMITVAAGGDDLYVEDVRAFNTVVDCVSWLSLEAAVARPEIRDCVVQGTFSTGALMDEATATLCTIRSNVLKNTKAATAVVTFATGNSTGVMSFNHISGRHTTLASNVGAGTGMDFFENRVVEEAALNGAVIPAADAE